MSDLNLSGLDMAQLCRLPVNDTVWPERGHWGQEPRENPVCSVTAEPQVHKCTQSCAHAYAPSDLVPASSGGP